VGHAAAPAAVNLEPLKALDLLRCLSFVEAAPAGYPAERGESGSLPDDDFGHQRVPQLAKDSRFDMNILGVWKAKERASLFSPIIKV
jgi:hypothetical protein